MRSLLASAWTRLPLRRLPTWSVIVIAVGLLAIDSATSPYFSFSSIFILFVVLVSWFNGGATGIALSLFTPLARGLLLELSGRDVWERVGYWSTTASRVVVWCILALIASRLAAHERTLRRQRDALRALLPLCTYCHRIRSADDTWESLEAYAVKHEGQYPPGLCPDCASSRFPEHFPPTGGGA